MYQIENQDEFPIDSGATSPIPICGNLDLWFLMCTHNVQLHDSYLQCIILDQHLHTQTRFLGRVHMQVGSLREIPR